MSVGCSTSSVSALYSFYIYTTYTHLYADRKSSVLTLNTKAVSTHSKDITADTKALSTKLDEFIKISDQSSTKLRDEAKKYETKELETLANQSERIKTQLQKVQDAMKTVQSNDASSGEAIATIQAAVTETQEIFKDGFLTWSETLRTTCEAICKELQVAGTNGLNNVCCHRYLAVTLIHNSIDRWRMRLRP